MERVAKRIAWIGLGALGALAVGARLRADETELFVGTARGSRSRAAAAKKSSSPTSRPSTRYRVAASTRRAALRHAVQLRKDTMALARAGSVTSASDSS